VITELTRRLNLLQRQVDGLIKPEVGRWMDWTPTVTQSVAVTVTVTYARYVVFGDSAIIIARLGVTSAGTGNNVISVAGLPTIAQIANPNTLGVIGTGLVTTGGGTTIYQGALIGFGANELRFFAHNATNYFGVVPNFALANGDVISFQAAYER